MKRQKNRNSKRKSAMQTGILVIVSMLLLYVGNGIATKHFSLEGRDNTPAAPGHVVRIIDEVKENLSMGAQEMVNRDLIFEVELDADHSKVIAVQNQSAYVPTHQKDVEVGDAIVLFELSNETYGTEWVFGEYNRMGALRTLALIFAFLLLLFGGIKGVKTLISLILTVLAVFWVFVPAILSGYNIYLWTLLICVFTIAMTLLLVSGFNVKSAVAIIGCTGGVLLSALLVMIMGSILHLTGVFSEESVYLLMINPEAPIDLKAVFFGAIVIGAMGAIMDVAMSISSSLHEIAEKYSRAHFSDLLVSGLTIGRDIMGTMANTLVLAYIGSSLSVVLLLFTYSPSLVALINREMVVIEILQALIGSMGILLTLPLTAATAAAFYPRVFSQRADENPDRL